MPVPAAPSSECSKKHKAAAAVVEQQEQLAPATQNEFELQRLRRIEHNRQVMRELGVEQAAAAIKASMEESKQQRCVKRKKVSTSVPGTAITSDLLSPLSLLVSAPPPKLKAVLHPA
jgi:hypothetical protein